MYVDGVKEKSSWFSRGRGRATYGSPAVENVRGS